MNGITLGGSLEAGRFKASATPLSVTDAEAYCRGQGGSLASIHSWAEQQQAVSACAATGKADGSTLSDQASGAGYGCWIGFQDIGDQGGFAWSDGSNVDFVDWAPMEPNGAFGQSAVVIDLRGHLGGASGMARDGEWNDDARASGNLLYPICQTSMPTATAEGVRTWGAGSSTSFNIRLCVDSDDYLFFQVLTYNLLSRMLE